MVIIFNLIFAILMEKHHKMTHLCIYLHIPKIVLHLCKVMRITWQKRFIQEYTNSIKLDKNVSHIFMSFLASMVRKRCVLNTCIVMLSSAPKRLYQVAQLNRQNLEHLLRTAFPLMYTYFSLIYPRVNGFHI